MRSFDVLIHIALVCELLRTLFTFEPLDIAVDEFMLGEVTGVEKTPPAALEIADIFPLRHISIHSL